MEAQSPGEKVSETATRNVSLESQHHSCRRRRSVRYVDGVAGNKTCNIVFLTNRCSAASSPREGVRRPPLNRATPPFLPAWSKLGNDSRNAGSSNIRGFLDPICQTGRKSNRRWRRVSQKKDGSAKSQLDTNSLFLRVPQRTPQPFRQRPLGRRRIIRPTRINPSESRNYFFIGW